MSKTRGTPEQLPQPKRIFLGWNEPLAYLVADWLWQARDRLPRRLVVVPTRESGRRLRELLLERAAQRGQKAVLGPRLATPDDFFRPETRMPDCVRWAGWLRAMATTDDNEVSNLFPAGISQKDQAWRLGVARQIEQARELLAAVDVGFDQVAEALDQDRERWFELAKLEKGAIRAWSNWGVEDPVADKRKRAGNPLLPPGVEDLIIAGVPDPVPLAIEAWRRLSSKGLPVSVLIGAPEKLAASFDDWGRPVPEFWIDRQQHDAPRPDKFYLAADATSAAEAVVQSCAGRSNREVAIGVCDSNYIPALSRRFREAGWRTYDPEGLTVARDGWPSLFDSIAEALEAPDDFGALARLARHSTVWNTWLKDCGARSAFAVMDRWEKEKCACAPDHAIAELAGSEQQVPRAMGELLSKVRDFIELGGEASEREFVTRLRTWLARASREVREWLNAELDGWSALGRCAETAGTDGLGLAQRVRWLSASVASLKENPDPSAAVLALQGWLELLYENSPHLVLAGLHEGKVPEAPASNPLISEPVRERFGVRDRKSRFARDVFLYTSLVEGRRVGGTVTVVNAQVDPQGEPCKPSRVLLQASPEELPARVQAYIRETPDVPLQPTPAWSRGDWLLRPGPGTPRNRQWEHVSPSTLKAYLGCPTRFYFTEVLACERFEPFRQELDGAAFGELLHKVFQLWGSDQKACQETDPGKLRAYWFALLKQVVQESFGANLPPLVQLQVLSAEERLGAFAEAQAQQSKAGWRIIELEKRYVGTLTLAGVPLKVRVDRVDQHEDGSVRVIDYKTARKGLKPVEAHLRAYDEQTCPAPLGPLVENGRRPRVWSDLQLPLYALTVQKALNLKSLPKVYYVLLPEAVGETDFAEFEGLDQLVENAQAWAEEATRRIVAGVFWPPAVEVDYDAFAAAAPEGLHRALGPEWEAFLSGPPSADRAQKAAREPAYLKL